MTGQSHAFSAPPARQTPSPAASRRPISARRKPPDRFSPSSPQDGGPDRKNARLKNAWPKNTRPKNTRQDSARPENDRNAASRRKERKPIRTRQTSSANQRQTPFHAQAPAQTATPPLCLRMLKDLNQKRATINETPASPRFHFKQYAMMTSSVILQPDGFISVLSESMIRTRMNSGAQDACKAAPVLLQLARLGRRRRQARARFAKAPRVLSSPPASLPSPHRAGAARDANTNAGPRPGGFVFT